MEETQLNEKTPEYLIEYLISTVKISVITGDISSVTGNVESEELKDKIKAIKDIILSRTLNWNKKQIGLECEKLRKRQRKKNSKKYLRVVMDEAPLLCMTLEEQQNAYKEFLYYREKYAFRKKYKELKNQKHTLYYIPPVSKKAKDWIDTVSAVGRRNRIS